MGARDSICRIRLALVLIMALTFVLVCVVVFRRRVWTLSLVYFMGLLVLVRLVTVAMGSILHGRLLMSRSGNGFLGRMNRVYYDFEWT